MYSELVHSCNMNMPTKNIFSPEGEKILKAFALSLPEAVEEHPWNHDAIKVRKKTFVFLSGAQRKDGSFSLSAKLPESAEFVLIMPFASPTGYGLGKSNWVTAEFAAGEEIPIDMLKDWILESYRAIAPKTLAKQT